MRTALVFVILNDGTKVEKLAWAAEGGGIYDDADAYYPAGIDATGMLFADSVDAAGSIYRTDGSGIVPGWNLDGRTILA